MLVISFPNQVVGLLTCHLFKKDIQMFKLLVDRSIDQTLSRSMFHQCINVPFI